MPKTSALASLRAFFKRKCRAIPPNTPSIWRRDSVEGSTLPYILEGPIVRPGGTPGWASQPWHYVFQDGDVAWALGGNGLWRLVTVVGDGFLEEIENRQQVAYSATWKCDETTMRGTFAPGCGNIKPNTIAIRRLLFDEGPHRVEKKGWYEVLRDDDYDDDDIGSCRE